MPLAFQSLNQGPIAFGFFNIDTDLLLLEHYFFFADDFCRYMVHLAQRKGSASYEAAWEVHEIARPMDVGDLMGAIHGVRYVGFIGDVYRRFPFPQSQADFKQKPEGFQNRSILKPILDTYARVVTISFHADREHETMAIGPYLFTKEVFQQLINYVWLGGYPQWRDGIQPDYVLDMRKELERSSSWIFAGLHLP